MLVYVYVYVFFFFKKNPYSLCFFLGIEIPYVCGCRLPSYVM